MRTKVLEYRTLQQLGYEVSCAAFCTVTKTLELVQRSETLVEARSTQFTPWTVQDAGTGSASIPAPWSRSPTGVHPASTRVLSSSTQQQHQRGALSFIGRWPACGQEVRVHGVGGTSPGGQRGPALPGGGQPDGAGCWGEPAGPGAQSGARLRQGPRPPPLGVVRAMVVALHRRLARAATASVRPGTSACGTWRPAGPPLATRPAARD